MLGSAQVMAREMFNPNFSLFVPMPAGGSTFQPNPNSIVQNDEVCALESLPVAFLCSLALRPSCPNPPVLQHVKAVCGLQPLMAYCR